MPAAPALLLLLLGALALLAAPASAAQLRAGFSRTWAWTRVAEGARGPAPRQGHSAVEVGEQVYVFGGCAREVRCYGDLWIFSAPDLAWRQEAFTGQWPSPRGGHTATLVGASLFVYGGASSEETFSEVYRLDLTNRHWSLVRVEPAPGSTPGRRTGHAAAADAHGRVYVFGGFDGQGNFLNDMWLLSVARPASALLQASGVATATWSKPASTGVVPAARDGHSLTLIDRKLLLFGGYSASGEVLNDLHAYDLDSLDWARLSPTTGLPPPRQAHAAARHGRELVVAGGCDVAGAPRCLGDVWSLDMLELRWTLRSPGSPAWAAREGHSSTFVRGQLFLFGGCDLGAACYSDVAALDTFEPCPAGCGGHGACAAGGFCRCTARGYTGHDCMQPASCPLDCGSHGECAEDGQCRCENGWGGADCRRELPCPGGQAKCNGHGLCLESGSCQCFPGFAGPACGSVSLLQSGRRGSAWWPLAPVGPTNASGAARAWGGPWSALLGLGGRAAGDLGVGMVANPPLSGGCGRNCNHNGICKDGVCFCRPGWTGDDCALDANTVSLGKALFLTSCTGAAAALLSAAWGRWGSGAKLQLASNL